MADSKTKIMHHVATNTYNEATLVNGKSMCDGREMGYYVVHSTDSTAEGQVVQQTTKIVSVNHGNNED